MAIKMSIQCFLSGQNDERVFAVAWNSRSVNLFDNEETGHKDWSPFKMADENVSSTTKRQISERERLNEPCQSKKKLFLSKLFLRTVFKFEC